MKTLLICLGFMSMVSLAEAQSGQGRRDPAQMKEMMKQRLMEELKFPAPVTDSVVNIQMEYQVAAREVRQDQGNSAEEKTAATKKLGEIRDAKLKAILTKEQFSSLEAYNEKMRKQREERQKNGQ